MVLFFSGKPLPHGRGSHRGASFAGLLSRAAVPDRLEFVANWRKACFAAFLLAWFLYFNWSSLRVHFAPDDMMNLAYYFRAGPWRLAGALITPWTEIGRAHV